MILAMLVIITSIISGMSLVRSFGGHIPWSIEWSLLRRQVAEVLAIQLILLLKMVPIPGALLLVAWILELYLREPCRSCSRVSLLRLYQLTCLYSWCSLICYPILRD